MGEPYTEAGEECEDEGAAKTQCYELTATSALLGRGEGGRRVMSKSEPGKKAGPGNVACTFVFISHYITLQSIFNKLK